MTLVELVIGKAQVLVDPALAMPLLNLCDYDLLSIAFAINTLTFHVFEFTL